ncbi:MAG: YidC/Oxa1 family membrane protein insertase [Candidatus Magasanikbacteria bacterium]|nr:YidC/Oxa1 family membrane protein insertase [Candidatus Magasanikbacteria bacterium]
MFNLIWSDFLYQPLFNVLIFLYNTIAGQNLGWAVVWLTVLLRVALLPLTIISEFTEVRRQKAAVEAEKAIVAYKNDRVAQKEIARKIMRKYHISPWAKVLMLGIQLLVLILLYQVFISGISGTRMARTLYPGVDYPGAINVDFYGFNIGTPHDIWWSGICAIYLLVSIYLERRSRRGWQRAEVFYWISFPLFTFAALWYLPMVKSLFILTTMVFSDIISLIRSAIRYAFKPAAVAKH